MRAARFMKWMANPLAGVAMVSSVIVGATTVWYVGAAIFLVPCGALYFFGYSRARCPHCGQVWWPSPFMSAPWWSAATEYTRQEDETESFVCRRCRIDIGIALRN